MRQTAVNFFSTDALTLEGIIAEPSGEEIPESGGDLPGVVFFSPEPHLGGTMLSPVVEALTREVTPRGFVSFRFNYRGVGESQGENALGEGQVSDALAAVDMLREWPGVDEHRLGIVGYSYGASIALRASAQQPEGVRAVVAVSPILDIPLIGIPTEGDMVNVKVPVRFLIGGNDGLTTPEKLGAWVDGIGREDVTAMALEGADRAWQTSRPALAAATAEFLDATMSLR
ncbi:MAG: alpha/beta fold hydrolase [Chloroflexi bacterium]|nr:alpha/beta fold hydrolase [Chloroflexota bacterium]